MKYVDKPCLKKFMRARWETDNESLWINPKCCKPVQNWSQWPEYILGCLSLLILSSVIITTIGMGRSKNIPPPDPVKGGFVKPPEEPDETSQDESEELVDESKEGGFVRKVNSQE